MKNTIIYGLCLSMPLWLIACGGSGGSSDSPPATTSGVSLGEITGFGSVFVNGIKFNTDNANIFRGDDRLNVVRDLQVGMRVRVEGDLQNHIANSVSFDEDVKGPADGAAIGNTFSVMGQTIITNPATIFNNTSLSTITAGDILEISGLRNADDDLVAGFIERKSSPADVKRYSVIGNVRNLDTNAKTFSIDDLSIDYSTANINDLAGGNPVAGQLVEVKDDNKAYTPGSSSLIATKVEPQNKLGNGGVAGAKVEIESIVTQVNSTSEFVIGGQLVTTSASTRFLFGTSDNIVTGVRLEVEGRLDDNDVLSASKVKFEDNNARIQAQVDSNGVDTTADTVTLLGITVSITGETQMEDKRNSNSSLSLSDIQDGDYLEIRGFIGANNEFVASELRRDKNDSKVEIRGPASAKDSTAGTVTVLGITANTSSNTQFQGMDDQPIAASQCFESIIEGLTVVKVKWDPLSDISQAAKEMELED